MQHLKIWVCLYVLHEVEKERDKMNEEKGQQEKDPHESISLIRIAVIVVGIGIGASCGFFGLVLLISTIFSRGG